MCHGTLRRCRQISRRKPLRDVQAVFGLCGRHESATESCILQGRDARSVRVLVPDPRDLEQNFHDMTVVDMGDLPESEVSIPELSDLTRKWPPAVIAHMRWRQPELEEMQQAAKLQYRKKQPAQCDVCSRTILLQTRGTLSLGFGPVVEMPSGQCGKVHYKT